MFFNTEEKSLLLNLFRLYGPSNKENLILEYIKNYLMLKNVPFKQDDNGNIYCLNHKNAPLLSAHTDCVGTAESGSYVRFVDIYSYGDDEIMKGLGNIGGDDKCGVFLILLYLATSNPINAVFSVCEEIGGERGIKHLLPIIKDDKIFKSIPYCIVLDRKNPGDIICYKNDYGSKEFEDALSKIGKKYNYSPVLGGSSDMNTIKNYMNGCNISVGYHNPHSTTEFVSLKELYNSWMYLQDLIKNMPKNIPMQKKSITEISKAYPIWSGTSDWDYYKNYDW